MARGQVLPTTLVESPRLNRLLGTRVILASEAFQRTGSFKFRAAWNLASSVPNTHIITASSGNFGQALAYACLLLGKRCTVVMPTNSASVKIEAVQEYGGEVERVDTASVSRAQRVSELAAQYPEAYVASAYDDALVIEGNATLGAELAQMDDRPNAFVVPIGGGGLASGVLLGLRRAGVETPVVGAEPALANDAARSLQVGRIVVNEQEPQTLADGARTVSLGRLNWEILQHGLQEILEVPEAEIVRATQALFALANLKAEPTGALATGALLAHESRLRDGLICCVVSGGNVDPQTYARLIA
jgi:threonine dehydratase